MKLSTRAVAIQIAFTLSIVSACVSFGNDACAETAAPSASKAKASKKKAVVEATPAPELPMAEFAFDLAYLVEAPVEVAPATAVAAAETPVVEPVVEAVDPVRSAPTPVVAAVTDEDDEVRWFGLGVRLGAMSMSLRADQMPFVQSEVNSALTKVNDSFAKAASLVPGMAAPQQYTVADISLRTTLASITPTMHLGGDGYFFKFDAPLGFGADTHSYGLGVYPINYGHYFRSIKLFPYAGVGLAASYVKTTITTPFHEQNRQLDAQGVVVQAGRLAFGAKYRPFRGTSTIAELGYTPFVLGGVVNANRMQNVQGAIVSNQGPVDIGFRGGRGSTVDFSLGLEWFLARFVIRQETTCA